MGFFWFDTSTYNPGVAVRHILIATIASGFLSGCASQFGGGGKSVNDQRLGPPTITLPVEELYCYANTPAGIGSFFFNEDPYADPSAVPITGCDGVTECTVDLDLLFVILGDNTVDFLTDDPSFVFKTIHLTDVYINAESPEVLWDSDEHWAFVVDGTYECDDADATVLTLSTEQGELNQLHGVAPVPLIMTGYAHASPEGEVDQYESTITEDGEIFRYILRSSGQQQFFRTCVRIP